MSGPVRVGLVGLGRWGPNIARNLDELADLRWLCDASPDVRERFARRYPATRLTGDLDDVLGDTEVEAVVVATPVVTHHELARRALHAGKHVFVEKPPALSAGEAEELCDIAEERSLV